MSNLKVVLRSLINSAPHGFTIEDLDRDYQVAEGKRIPFVALGYSRLYDLLVSMKDTLIVSRFISKQGI